MKGQRKGETGRLRSGGNGCIGEIDGLRVINPWWDGGFEARTHGDGDAGGELVGESRDLVGS